MKIDNGVPEDAPNYIGPGEPPKQKTTIGQRFKSVIKAVTTKEGLVGDYDYAFLFKPNLPFMKKTRRAAPFFGLHDKMPVLLALLLGFQHALSMLAGVITPPIIISGAGYANLTAADSQYLVSTSLIVCGILSAIQITRFHVIGTPYYVGTGLISVVGTSFAIIPIASGAFKQFYANGICTYNAAGAPNPCREGYGLLLGTSCCCALIEILLSFTPPRILKKIFPPLITGPTVALIGIHLVETGFQNWAGGTGPCLARPAAPSIFAACPTIYAPHALPWGSAQYIGLGFSVFITIILCERFGSPIMKSCSVVVGLLVGCIIGAATGYFPSSGVNNAPVASFIWVRTFPLGVYGPLVLPILAVYMVLLMEAIGDITATCDVSRLEVQGKMFDSRIQGGVLADGFNGLIAGLCTITPMSTFAQNNGVIALTRCANRKAGYCACFFLFIMGLFAKFAAALVSIPSAILGGLTTFLFASVAVSGIRIISTVPFTRRNRFILTAAFAIGFGATLVPNWFSFVFTYTGGGAKGGFLDAIVLVLETGFAIVAFVAIILNLTLPEEVEDEMPEVEATAELADSEGDSQEWNTIRHQKGVEDAAIDLQHVTASPAKAG